MPPGDLKKPFAERYVEYKSDRLVVHGRMTKHNEHRVVEVMLTTQSRHRTCDRRRLMIRDSADVKLIESCVNLRDIHVGRCAELHVHGLAEIPEPMYPSSLGFRMRSDR
jgi:hypothetical protein